MRFLVFAFLFYLFSMTCFCGVPTTFIYSGAMLNSDGNVVAANSSKTFQVSLYDVKTGGTAQYTQTLTMVPVRNGYFKLEIGPALPDLSVYRWLELRIDNELMVPRIELSAKSMSLYSAKAFQAETANNSIRFGGFTTSEFAAEIQNTFAVDATVQKVVSGGWFLRKDQSDSTRGSITMTGPGTGLYMSPSAAESYLEKIQVKDYTGKNLFSVNSSGGVTAQTFYGSGAGLTGVTADFLNRLQIQGTGNIVISAPAVISGTNSGDLRYPFASSSVDGILSSTDYQNFSNKQDKLTNPIYGALVVDSLVSTLTTNPLSARQGSVLKTWLTTFSQDFKDHIVTGTSSGVIKNPHMVTKSDVGLDKVTNVNVFNTWEMGPGQYIETDAIKARGSSTGISIVNHDGSLKLQVGAGGPNSNYIYIIKEGVSKAGLSVDGQVVADGFTGDGSNLSNILAAVGNQNIAGSLNVTQNVTAAYFYGSGRNLNDVLKIHDDSLSQIIKGSINFTGSVTGIDKSDVGLNKVDNEGILDGFSINDDSPSFIGTNQIKMLATKELRIDDASGQSLLYANSLGTEPAMAMGVTSLTPNIKFQIKGSSSFHPLVITTAGTSSKNALMVASSGKIGINSNVPMNLMDVNGVLFAAKLKADEIFSKKAVFSQSILGSTSNIANGQGHVNLSRGGITGDSALSKFCTISGGQMNVASGSWSTVSGGRDNIAKDDYSSVTGGFSNTAVLQYSVISGGKHNFTSGDFSVITGGSYNSVSAKYGIIGGGHNNAVSGQYSVIPGGREMIVSGDSSFGFNSTTAQVVVSDSSVVVFSGAKVGIGTVSPKTHLQVTGGGVCVGSQASCAGTSNSQGVVYSTATAVIGADYAEYFPSEEPMEPGELVGFNFVSGKVRRYISGDMVLGVISTQPGIIGNRGNANKAGYALVALLGQVPVKSDKLRKVSNRFYTADGQMVGVRLSDGRLYLAPENGSRYRLKYLEDRVNQQQEQIKDLMRLVEQQMNAIQMLQER
jgi:hypothetical protein